jgi:hypothetical protein
MSKARKAAWQRGLYNNRETEELSQLKSKLRKIDWQRGIYGSKSHRQKMAAARKKAWDNGLYGSRTAHFTKCKTCSEIFWTTRDACFCSVKCYGKATSERQRGSANPMWGRTGTSNPNWQDGKSFETYPLDFNAPFKRKIRERDNYTCAICKLFGNDVHHINYQKENTIPGNCITLCRSCHSKTNSDRRYWQIALYKLLSARIDLQTAIREMR